MELNTLPDLCLRHIFSRLPVKNLLKIHHVCHRWASLQPSVTCKYKNLSIHLNDSANQAEVSQTDVLPYADELIYNKIDSLENPSKNLCIQLKYNQLNAQINTFLSECFPQITKLEIKIHSMNVRVIDPLIHLLGNWKTNLIHLKIRSRNLITEMDHQTESEEKIANQLLNLLNYINGSNFPELKSLTLGLNHQLFPNAAYFTSTEQLRMPILNQLESFTFSSNSRRNCLLWNSLNEHVFENSISKLMNISLSNAIYSRDHMTKFNALDAQIATRFTHLSIDYSDLTFNELHDFCLKYTNLTSLQLFIGELSLQELTNCLVLLPRLVHLHLSGNFEFLLRHPLPVYDLLHEQDHHLSLGQLLSVKEVTLQFGFDSHLDTHSMYWGWIFPNVEVLRVYRASQTCQICDYHDLEWIELNSDVLHECAREIMRNWIAVTLEPLESCGKIEKFFSICPGDDVRVWGQKYL